MRVRDDQAVSRRCAHASAGTRLRPGAAADVSRQTNPRACG
jgi:hypothetical protein